MPDQDLNNDPLVVGQIVIPAKTRGFQDGTAHIRLEDVSHANGKSIVKAQTTILQVSHDSKTNQDTSISFELHPLGGSQNIDRRHDYSVRVWIDTDSDGQESGNDLYSDQSYPVLTRGFGNNVTITVRQRSQ